MPDEPTDQQMSATSRAPTPHAATRHGRLVPALLGLVLISLALHGWTWWTLLRLQAMAQVEATALADRVAETRRGTIEIEVPVRGMVPVKASVPFELDLEAEVRTELPFREVIELPIVTPLQTFVLPLPIDVTIPVSATVPVRVEDTLSILTEVEIDFDVPVRVVISETALGASLDQLEASLRRWGGGDR